MTHTAHRRRRRWPWLSLAVVAVFNGGCALLPISGSRVPAVRGDAAPPAADANLHEYRGVIHIHTTYSDGTGTYAEIIRTARQQRLDFLIVTDHNTLQAFDEHREGWYPPEATASTDDGRTLVLANDEISAPDGHVVAIGVTQPVSRDQSSQAIIDAIEQQGGLAFLAHPHYARKPWTNWSVQRYTGMEIYNFAEDAATQHKLLLVLRGMACTPDAFYRRLIRRPTWNLAQWDRLLSEGGRIVGIGSADAHGLRPLRLRLAPYDLLFRTIRTHVLAPELSRARLLEALRAGHAYAALDLLGDATGFVFRAEAGDGHVAAQMGDQMAWAPNLSLVIYTPTTAELRLMRDGQLIGTRRAQQWRHRLDAPGVYRLEVFLHHRFWIASNPIYVRPPVLP